MFTKEQGVTVFAVCMAYELVAHSSRGPCTALRVLFGRSHRILTKTAEVRYHRNRPHAHSISARATVKTDSLIHTTTDEAVLTVK
jgi:hypothetical protein